MTTFATLAVEPIVLDPVIEQLGLNLTAAALAERVEAVAEVNTAIVEVAVTDPSPIQAAAIATAVADQLTQTVGRLSPEDSDGRSTVEPAIVAPAVVPTSAASPNILVNLATRVLEGLLLGLGGAFLRRSRTLGCGWPLTFWRSPRHPYWVRSASSRRGQGSLVVADMPSGLHAEAFRQNRTNLQFLGVEEQARSIVVTSALPAEGKSAVAANLAVALAETSSRVLLIDADLRRPSIAPLMAMEGAAGLTTVLIGRAEFGDVVQEWGEGMLHVLPSGEIPPNPSELLDPPAMTQLLEAFEERHDYVIVDSAPLLPVTDAAILSRVAMGTIVVANAKRVRRHQLTDALGFLGQLEGRVLGVVLSATTKDGEEYGYTPHPVANGAARPAWASVEASSPLPDARSPAVQREAAHGDGGGDVVPVTLRGQAFRAKSETRALRWIPVAVVTSGVTLVSKRRSTGTNGRGDTAEGRGLARKDVPGSTAAPRSRPRP